MCFIESQVVSSVGNHMLSTFLMSFVLGGMRSGDVAIIVNNELQPLLIKGVKSNLGHYSFIFFLPESPMS